MGQGHKQPPRIGDLILVHLLHHEDDPAQRKVAVIARAIHRSESSTRRWLSLMWPMWVVVSVSVPGTWTLTPHGREVAQARAARHEHEAA